MKIANIGNGYVSNETIGRLPRTRVAGLDERAGADDYQHAGSFRQAAAESALFDEMKKRDDELQGRFDGAPTWDARDIRDYARLESTARMMLQHREDHTDMEFAGIFRELHKRRFLDTPELETAFDRPGDEHANEGRLEDFLAFTDRLNTAKTAEEQQAIIAEQYGKTMPEAMSWEDVKKKSNDGGASYARAYLEKNGRDWGDKAKSVMRWVGNLARVETEANPDYVPEDKMSPEQRGREMALNVFGLGQTPTRFKKWSPGFSEPVFTDADAINEMNERFAMDKARLHAAQTLPFLNQTQRDIVNLAASGADMSRFRGMLKLMKPKDRELMRNLINAAIPTYDDIDWIPDEGVLRLGSGASNMGRSTWSVLKGSGELALDALKGKALYVKGDWYNPFSWRMHLISDGAKKRFDEIAQAGLEDSKDYDAIVRRKYKTDSGFFGKAWSGLCESAPLQLSAIGGEVLKRQGKAMIRRGNAKFGVPIAATGYGLQAFMTLSFWGEHYENMLTHGVPPLEAFRISFGAACVDTVIETANLDTWFGKGLTADELRLIGFRGILRSAASRDAGVFWRSFKANAKHAAKVGFFEDIEEAGQAWNKAGALNYAEGKSLADAYLNSAAFNDGLEAFVDALPTCTAFGITGMADVTGSLRNSALPTYRDNLENVAREMAKREKAQGLGGDVLDKYMAKVNNIAQKISVAMAGKSAKQVGEYLNAQTDMSPAERAFYAEYCALNSAMTATDGANYAAAVLSGSFNEALFTKEGWKFEHDPNTGAITGITSPDGKVNLKMNVFNREATLEDFDNERLYDFVTEYNRLVATHPDYKDDAPFAQVGQDTAKADVDAWSAEEKARLAEAVKKTPGFTNKDGITIFMLAKNKLGEYRNEGTVTHEVMHNLLTKLQETSSKRSEKAIRALLATLGMNLDDKKLSMQIADEEQAILGEKAAMLDTTAAIANVLPDKIDGKALAHNIVEAIRRVASLGLSRGEFVDAFVENRRAETFKDGTPIASGVDPAYYFRNILKNAISDYRKLNAMQREEKAEHKKLVEKILAERKAKRQRKIGLRASERAAHERAERAAAEAEARRIEGERRAAEARAAAERREMERRELQYFLSRQTNTMPNLVANDNAVAEGRGAQAVAAYRILWKLAKGQNLTDDEKNTLGEEYGLPIEALTHPESFSDADMARLQDGITRLWTDAANANIVVPPVYVATEADQHRVLPNEVYDPVFQLFRNGEVVVDATRAVPFTPQFAPGAAPDASEETDEETPDQTATSVPTGSQAAPTAAPAAQRAPVGGHDVAPAPREDVFEFHRGGTLVRLVGGLWNWMHKPFNYKNESPTASRQDADGHGLWNGRRIPEAVSAALAAWKDHCPKYMGNKNEMLKRVVQAICNNFTTAEREGYTHLNDCFGGGGCWGLSIAMTALPNVKHIIVNEFDEGRIEKIRVLHTLDGQMEAKLRAFLGTRNVVPRIEARMRAQVSERTGNTLSPNGFNTRRWCYEALETEIAHLSSEDKGILWAFLDNLQSQMQWAKRDASGANSLAAIIEFTIKSVSKDAVKATELAEAFKARGGEITYSAGDAKQQADFGTKKDTDGVYRRGASGEPLAVPHGGNVMSVTDPPYYLTEGYGESGTRSRVGLEADPMGWGYGDTQQMLGTLVDLRDGIVYTDEAWWFKPEYRFDEARTPREEQILGSIISDFDHFDVAGGVAGRQETLGVQHGRTQETVADGENAGNDVNAAGLPDGSGVRDVLQPAVPAVAAAAEGQDASTPRSDDRSGGQRFWDGNPDTLVDAVTSGATIPRRLRGYANRLLGEAAGAQLRAAGITRFSILPKSGFGIIRTDEGKSYTFDARVHADSPLDLPSYGDRTRGARSTPDPDLAATVDRVLLADGVPGEKPSSSPSASFSRKALLNLFNALNTDAESAELFNRVFPVIDRLGINYSLGQFTGADNTASERGYVLGYYDEHGNVVFNSNVLLRLPPSKFAETILHESIHAVSAYAIARVRNELRMPKAMLNETQRKAAEELVSLFNDIRGFASSHYGWTDEHEMLAELANPEFRAVLRERGVLERIIDAVKRLFGIEPQTDLDKAVDILDRFLAGADAEAVEAQYRDHYRNNLDLSLFVTNYKYNRALQTQEELSRPKKLAQREAQVYSDLILTRLSINPSTPYSDRGKYTRDDLDRMAGEGDVEAVAEWFAREWGRLTQMLKRRFGFDEPTCDDVIATVQEKMIKHYVTDAEKRPDGGFGAYATTSIKNLALKTYTGRAGSVRSREATTLDRELDDESGDTVIDITGTNEQGDIVTGAQGMGIAGQFLHELAKERVRELLSHYSGEELEVFKDKWLNGKTVDAISEERGIPRSVVINTLARMANEMRTGSYANRTASESTPTLQRVPERVRKVFDFFAENPFATVADMEKATGVNKGKVSMLIKDGVEKYGLSDPRQQRPAQTDENGNKPMPEHIKAVCELADQGMNYPDAAAALGITVDEAKRRITSARSNYGWKGHIGMGDAKHPGRTSADGVSTEEKRARACSLSEQGLTNDEIAQRLGIEKTYVSTLLSQARKLGWTGGPARLPMPTAAHDRTPSRFAISPSTQREFASDPQTASWTVYAEPHAIRTMSPERLVAEDPLTDKTDNTSVVKAMRVLFTSIGAIRNDSDGNYAVFNNSDAGKMLMQSGADMRTFAPHMKRLFEGALLSWSEPPLDMKGHTPHPDVLGYKQYINKFTDADGIEKFVRFTVREHKGKDGRRGIHAATISEVSVYQDESAAATSPANKSGGSNRNFTDGKIAKFLSKGKGVSAASTPAKPSLTRFSITPSNPQTAAKYYLARDIIMNGGRLPDSRYVAHVARSFGLAGNPSELINAAMAEAATQNRVLRFVTSDPQIERAVANVGKSVRYENMLKRGREVLLKYSKDADEAKEHQQRALEKTVKSVRGEDYERMVTREGIDLDAILRAIRPAEKPPKAHDGSTPDASPDGSATPTPATEAHGKALAERVIERAKELVEAAKEAVRTRSETASTDTTAENAAEAGEEPAGRAGADETADDADAEASAVAAAYRRAIAESGITLDNPAEVVQLVKAVTEKYIRDNPGEVSGLDPADVWASPIARAMFAGNLARWAQDVAAAYSPSHARIRVAKKCQMLNDRGVNTVASLERIGEEIFRDLNKDIIRQSRASLIGDIRKIAKGAGAHFTERVEAKDRKVSANTARYCKFVTWALNVPAAKVEETMLELEAFLNGYGGDLSEADKNRYKDYAEAQLKRQLLDQYGNLRARMPAELTEIRDHLAQMVDEGRFDSMCFSEQWEDARNAGVEAIVPGIVADPADKGVQPEPSYWRDWVYSLVGMWETKWRQLTRFCKDDAARTRALEMTSRVEELIQSAEDTQFNYMQEQKKKLRDLLVSVYGGFNDARKALSVDIDPAIGRTLDRGDQSTHWNVCRLLQMYVSCVQPDYADNCAKYGRDAAYVAHLEEVIRALDPRHFALITGLRSLYLEQGDALSAVMERTSGTRLYTPNRVYMPVDPLRTHDIGKKGEGRGYSPFAASLTPRVKHGLDFDQRTDILELFVDRAEDAAHTIGWAENGSMVLGICQSDRVLNAIRTAFGSKAMGQWNNYVLDILAGKNETSSGDEAKFMGVLARYASRLWIGLNPVSWTKQIMSFPCFALSLDGSLKDVVCSGAFWLLHPIQMFRCAKDLADTRAFQARYGIAISQELKYATSTEGAFKTWWAKYIDAIMKGVYSFDKLTVMMQAGIYRRRRAQLEKNGMPAHEASETAASWLMHIVDKTAQTARTLNTTQLQRAGGAWAFFLQFKSAPAQQSQFEVVAAQEAMANPRDAKRWKKLAEVIAINHIIVPAMNTAIESLFAAAVQGGMPDEEKRKRQLATLLANMLSGSLGSIVFIGLVVEGLASALMDLCVLDRKPSAYNFGRSQIPAFSVIGNAFGSYNQFAKALEEMDYNGVTHTAIEMATAIGGVIPGLSWPSRTAEKAHKAMEE